MSRIRIENIFFEEMHGDSSFTEKDNLITMLLGGTKYSKLEMRETWDRGIKHGIEIGLRRASIEGQIIELNNNVKDKNSKEFLSEFFKLSEKYNCAIQYHELKGMIILNQNRNEQY